ncbi:hypothetical protein ACTM4P_14985 [Citrobacter freundii]|uniref:hypothetical protein n=1 Tax=Citrobacter freundii TaxID=546 RepID=UPI0028BEF0B2|nr:hypothetical protein [Citrobacter freundii]MDT7053707.1 hypothetical protein [Citrobacter freundii]
MKYTMKVYKNSPDYHTFLKARFDKSNSGQSFEWAGHRWAYEVTSFDDTGDYELLYRFDDKPYQEEVSVTTDDMTIRDYFAAKALGLCFAQYLNHAEAEGSRMDGEMVLRPTLTRWQTQCSAPGRHHDSHPQRQAVPRIKTQRQRVATLISR